MSILKNTIHFVLVSMAVIFTQFAIAETKIHEVQPEPSDAPSQLVIWGSDFGDSPKIFFGTYPDPLVINGGSQLCNDMTADPAPPLEPTGFDCVVVDLPAVNNGSGEPLVPSGDYLLKIINQGDGEPLHSVCSIDGGEGKPSSLTFLYNSTDCSGSNAQDGSVCVGDDMAGAEEPITMTATGSQKGVWEMNQNPISSGIEVTFTSSDKWKNQLDVTFESPDGSTQSIGLHTSCSQPLIVGDQYGSFTLIDFDNKTGGVWIDPPMQMDLYDLTLGAVGPEGPQGDTGDAGPKGDTGDAGPKGDTGDAGAKGDTGNAGAKGDTGDAGPKGDTGDAGAIGDTGNAGAKGDTGDAGLACWDLNGNGVGNGVGVDAATDPEEDINDDGAYNALDCTGDAGAKGDTGDAGAKGDTGDAGAKGDTGNAGAKGDTGDAGAKGDTGNAGPKGDTGDAGNTGAKGDTGDAGAKGDTGDAGPQGAKGSGENLLCFSTDQTIGTQGKYIGLGTQGGSHDQVSVITPFAAGATITTFVIKVANANGIDGEGSIYHDGIDEMGSLIGSCILTSDTPTSVCSGDGSGTPLTAFDSLSVFIETATGESSGSFQGGSACVLIDSPPVP